MKIVVIGGTGLIGSKLSALLRQRGQEALAASPDTGVNTLTGEGLPEALVGAQVVVDVANSPSFEAIHRRGARARHAARLPGDRVRASALRALPLQSRDEVVAIRREYRGPKEGCA